MEAGVISRGGGSGIPKRSPRARLADPAFRWALTAMALGLVALIVYFFILLIVKAEPTLSHVGVLSFAFSNNWDFGGEIFKAWPLLVGTLVTSALALLIGVPIAIATALFISELCPRRMRIPLTVLVDLTAAVPSVVFGLWGFFFLAPKLQGTAQWIADRLSFIPIIGGGHAAGPSYFVAGLVLAIMILPIVSAISREVIATVPLDHKEAALALGATRWEMIRMAVLPYSRAGIAGASMLGLGRAIGEAIAVSYVIGGNATLIHHIVEQGDSLAATIARSFNEANANQRGALIACGLLLFVLTLVVNFVARYFVARSTRALRAPPAAEPVASGAV
ncbi:MAG: phosphate ABC transporter permease subunit PstC [Solirubrobacteraceae bacterium]|nr:MAG: phosphate ABC transporter permease subunit PstC [Solirubrobacterales bacterium]